MIPLAVTWINFPPKKCPSLSRSLSRFLSLFLFLSLSLSLYLSDSLSISVSLSLPPKFLPEHTHTHKPGEVWKNRRIDNWELIESSLSIRLFYRLLLQKRPMIFEHTSWQQCGDSNPSPRYHTHTHTDTHRHIHIHRHIHSHTRTLTHTHNTWQSLRASSREKLAFVRGSSRCCADSDEISQKSLCTL